MWNKLTNWGMRKLSRVGKEVMLKTVAQALPNYIMSVFLLPRGLCHGMESMFSKIWWRNTMKEEKGIHWLSWDWLCRPKKVGGIGFKLLRDFVLSLLSNIGGNFWLINMLW